MVLSTVAQPQPGGPHTETNTEGNEMEGGDYHLLLSLPSNLLPHYSQITPTNRHQEHLVFEEEEVPKSNLIRHDLSGRV